MPEIKSYDVPETGYLSPEDAKQALSKMDADTVGDKLHPYLNAHHPQHSEFVTARTKLHEAAAPEPEPQTTDDGEKLVRQFGDKSVAAMSEGLEVQKEKQTARVEEATVLMNELVKDYNFEPITIPADVPDWKIRGWRMQKSLAQKKYSEVADALRKELRLLKAPSETMALLESAIIMPPRHQDTGFAGLIADVFAANKRRAARIASSKTFGG